MKPLDGMRVLNLALNLPGPVAAARLAALGATVRKVEPPDGDPLERACAEWYRELHCGQEVLRLNLKDPADRARLDERLAGTDLLLTSFRPSALERLGLAWPRLAERFPRLCQVAIIGYPPPDADRPGHDLNYQGSAGLLTPPHLPRTCLADLAGAERAVSAALALLLARERGQGCGCVQVSLAEAAVDFAAPLRCGLTAPGGVLGGGFAGYQLYRARDGWIAVAALEPRFGQVLGQHLDLSSPSREELDRRFLERTVEEWQAWAAELDLPITAVRVVSVS
jgi:crotonobetainyl-CoA:carnitine CoA-transferase CaiB-like acyl-CoA transferase